MSLPAAAVPAVGCARVFPDDAIITILFSSGGGGAGLPRLRERMSGGGGGKSQATLTDGQAGRNHGALIPSASTDGSA
ncbi:hypothetical protein FQA47_016517 [Oryzias melastigma]|uniref:Uncharacterized protein n=1 Tax=Oryzias melastigma TaxID=30732 RepID=A0A834KZR8_ORYME|nr:hypothetical protein FQA47_016517 [Oryzias melastigma]